MVGPKIIVVYINVYTKTKVFITMHSGLKVKFDYDVIISHGPGCFDGFCSAWAVWRCLPQSYRNLLAKEGGFYAKPLTPDNESDSDDIEEQYPSTNKTKYVHPNSSAGAISLQKKGFPVVFVFMQPGYCPPSDLVYNKRVLILDLDMGDNLIFVVKKSKSTKLVDHHQSTSDTLKKYSDEFYNYKNKFTVCFDSNEKESGATLTWKLFHSKVMPPLVQVIRIADTWSWTDNPELFPRYIMKALYLKRSFRSFVEIEDTYLNWDRNFENYVSIGKTASEMEKSYIKKISKQTNVAHVETKDGKVYNVAYTDAPILHSEVGATMRWYAQKRFNIPIHFTATWKYASHKGLVSVSLRDPLPNINLATISRSINSKSSIINGGGGHVAAAGFSFYGIENLHEIFKNIEFDDVKKSDIRFNKQNAETNSKSGSPSPYLSIAQKALINNDEKIKNCCSKPHASKVANH